jgi:hypothetical protein
MKQYPNPLEVIVQRHVYLDYIRRFSVYVYLEP